MIEYPPNIYKEIKEVEKAFTKKSLRAIKGRAIPVKVAMLAGIVGWKFCTIELKRKIKEVKKAGNPRYFLALEKDLSEQLEVWKEQLQNW